jgi:cellulose synthase/poly-beta-1,6-N-acetylglucosamine synthase-like glycosyltransferase
VTGLGWVCVLVAVAWLYLVVVHGGYWLASQRLPIGAAGAGGAGAVWPRVAAIVPARNEADMLPVTLPTLLGQDYPGVLEVIVVDDRSEDGTGAAAASLGGVRVVAGKPQPEGERWAGKVWAMMQGLAAAPGGAEYLLFTDADIAWEPGALADLVRRRGTMSGIWSRRWRCCGPGPGGSGCWSRPSSISSRSCTRSGG